MINKKRKIIDNIYSRIDKLALKGITHQNDYFVLVDDLSYGGDYDNLLQCLYIYYNIDIKQIDSIQDIKNKTWKFIIAKTVPTLNKKIKKMYDTKGVYQTSFDIYKDDNTFIGQIVEEIINTDEAKYYLKNREFAKITRTRVTYLHVTPLPVGYDFISPTASVTTIIKDNNLDISEDNNLYNRYVKAINLLLK